MPGEIIHDPRHQMQARLDRIRKQGASPEYFLPRALKTLSGALAVAPKTEIAALSYREQSVDMKLNAPSLAALSQLSQYIDSKHDLKAEIQSSTPGCRRCRGSRATARPGIASAPMNKLRTWFFGLQQRERRVLTVGAIAVAVLILLFGLLLPSRARSPA